jgi:hypothetical protein
MRQVRELIAARVIRHEMMVEVCLHRLPVVK